MQAANITYGIETTTAALDDGDVDDEGGGEGLVKQKCLTENEELEKMMGVSDQVKAASMQVQQEETDIGAVTVSGKYKWLPDKLTGFDKTGYTQNPQWTGCTADSLTFRRKETTSALNNSEPACTIGPSLSGM